MYNKTYGAKYDSKLSRKEIAAAIRADLKSAQAEGKIPAGVKFSIRCRPRGRSIDCTIVEVPAGFEIQHRGVVLGQVIPQHTEHGRFSKAGGELLDLVREIHGAYNYDRSDIMTDYFDVNYYGHPDFSSELTSAERARFEAEAAAPKPEPQVEFLSWAGV